MLTITNNEFEVSCLESDEMIIAGINLKKDDNLKKYNLMVICDPTEDGAKVTTCLTHNDETKPPVMLEPLINAYDDLDMFKSIYSIDGKFKPEGYVYSVNGLGGDEMETHPLRKEVLTYLSVHLSSFKEVCDKISLDKIFTDYIIKQLGKVNEVK